MSPHRSPLETEGKTVCLEQSKYSRAYTQGMGLYIFFPFR